MDWAKATARGYKKHLSFGIWCNLYKRFYGNMWHHISWLRSSLSPYWQFIWACTKLIYVVQSIIPLTLLSAKQCLGETWKYVSLHHHFCYWYSAGHHHSMCGPMHPTFWNVCSWIKRISFPKRGISAISQWVFSREEEWYHLSGSWLFQSFILRTNKTSQREAMLMGEPISRMISAISIFCENIDCKTMETASIFLSSRQSMISVHVVFLFHVNWCNVWTKWWIPASKFV